MPRLTLEALEVIDAIDRKGSFSAAADSLYKVQSKISYTVKKLEEDIGVALFEKVGRKAVLTPAGRVLLEEGRNLLESADRLVEITRQTASGWESNLNIAIDSILDSSILFPLLEAFDEIHPGIEINLYEEVLGGSWEAILSNKVDLVVGAADAPVNKQGLVVKHLTDIQWIFAVARDHPLTRLKQPVSHEDIKNYRAVIVRDSSRQMPPLSRRVLQKQARLVVQTMEDKIKAQVAGRGVGYLPEHRAKELLKSGELVKLSLSDTDDVTPLHAVWKKNNKGAALKWFSENLLSIYRDQ